MLLFIPTARNQQFDFELVACVSVYVLGFNTKVRVRDYRTGLLSVTVGLWVIVSDCGTE